MHMSNRLIHCYIGNKFHFSNYLNRFNFNLSTAIRFRAAPTHTKKFLTSTKTCHKWILEERLLFRSRRNGHLFPDPYIFNFLRAD